MEFLCIITGWVTIATFVVQIGFPKSKRLLGNLLALTAAVGGIALFLIIGAALVWWLFITMVIIVGAANVSSHIFEYDTNSHAFIRH